MRLIDADALYKSFGASGNCNDCPLDAHKCQYYNEHTLMEFCERIDDAPTVDAEPVKHGHWTIEDIVTYERSYGGTLYEPVYKCSCCGRVTESYVRGDEPIMPEDADFPEFCGNCGAKMDEAKDGKI